MYNKFFYPVVLDRVYNRYMKKQSILLYFNKILLKQTVLLQKLKVTKNIKKMNNFSFKVLHFALLHKKKNLYIIMFSLKLS